MSRDHLGTRLPRELVVSNCGRNPKEDPMKKHSILSLTAGRRSRLTALVLTVRPKPAPAAVQNSGRKFAGRAWRVPGEDHGLQRLPYPLEHGPAGSGAGHDAHALRPSAGHGVPPPALAKGPVGHGSARAPTRLSPVRGESASPPISRRIRRRVSGSGPKTRSSRR